MIGSDVFIFPDTDPYFRQTLYMAALYSNKIHTLTPFNIVAYDMLKKKFDQYFMMNSSEELMYFEKFFHPKIDEMSTFHSKIQMISGY